MYDKYVKYTTGLSKVVVEELGKLAANQARIAAHLVMVKDMVCLWQMKKQSMSHMDAFCNRIRQVLDVINTMSQFTRYVILRVINIF